MASDPVRILVRILFRLLLQAYPGSFRERFAEQMLGTFEDLLDERRAMGGSQLAAGLAACGDAALGLVREHYGGRAVRSVFWITLSSACLLVVPYTAMRLTDEVVWTPGDFLAAGLLLFLAGSALAWLLSLGTKWTFRAAAVLTAGTALLLVWSTLAVGLIGAEGQPDNLWILLPLSGLAGGVYVSRRQDAGLARALWATAGLQLVVLPIVWITTSGSRSISWPEDLLAATALFGLLWTLAGWLYHHAGKTGKLQAGRN